MILNIEIMEKNLFVYSLKNLVLAFLQVSGFSFLFALPIKLLWLSVFSIFTIPFVPMVVTYWSIVGIIFILLTILKIIKTAF
jgi:hypothetical protein